MVRNQKPPRKRQYAFDGEIESIADAIAAIREIRDTPFVTDGAWPLDNFPFGFWFRGHSVAGYSPEPRVFRSCNAARPKELGDWDETNVFEHLKLRLPEYQHTYRSAFDWLCLMQHYSVPTRLLDWTESLLPALYFAANDAPKTAGELFILNARRLNVFTKGVPAISSIDDGGVVIRAEMASTRSAWRLHRLAEVRSALELEPLPLESDPQFATYSAPVAVFPSRLNQRMVFQSSVFTLHGGKCYVQKLRGLYREVMISAPVSLERVNELCPLPIMKRFRVTNKERILEDLFLMGVHEGTLFPEVDRQAIYLEKLWWYPKGRNKKRGLFRR